MSVAGCDDPPIEPLTVIATADEDDEDDEDVPVCDASAGWATEAVVAGLAGRVRVESLVPAAVPPVTPLIPGGAVFGHPAKTVTSHDVVYPPMWVALEQGLGHVDVRPGFECSWEASEVGVRLVEVLPPFDNGLQRMMEWSVDADLSSVVRAELVRAIAEWDELSPTEQAVEQALWQGARMPDPVVCDDDLLPRWDGVNDDGLRTIDGDEQWADCRFHVERRGIWKWEIFAAFQASRDGVGYETPQVVLLDGVSVFRTVTELTAGSVSSG